MSEFKELSFIDILGTKRSMGDFLGKKVIIVNTASECGFTPQYEQFQEIHDQFGDKVTVIGFPCNDFGGQEPQNESEIMKFCSIRYGVSFLLSEKVKVLGEQAHHIFKWLQKKELNGVGDYPVEWNFHKFFISESGELDFHLPSSGSPLSEEVLQWINK